MNHLSEDGHNMHSGRVTIACVVSAVCAPACSAQGIEPTDVLEPFGVEESDEFGSVVEISSGTIAIAAPLDDDRGEDAGAVYLFSGEDGQLVNKLLPSPAPGGQFGQAICFFGDRIAVGAPMAAGGGTVYVFDVKSGEAISSFVADGIS